MTTPKRRRAKPRAGMTIIEMMVAIVVLGVGMLGLAGFQLAAGKQARGAKIQQTAALVVQSRLDSLTSIRCSNLAPSGPQTGTATTLGVQEKWAVVDGNDIKIITDTVRFAGRAKALAYKSIIPCRD